MKGLVLLVLVAAAIAAAVFLINPGSPAKPAATAESNAPSGANAAVIPAAQFKVDNYRGGVLVMDFWATWCGPCKMAMPGVQKIHEHFAGRPVHVMGINCWEKGDPVAYMQKNGFTYGLVTGADALASSYGVKGIPTFIVLGVDGSVIHKSVGFDPDGEAKITSIIEAHLKKNGL